MNAFRFGEHFFVKIFAVFKKSCNFAITKKEQCSLIKRSVVQLVRMPPCHGGGRGFESRPDRKKVYQLLFKKLIR